MKRLMIAAGIAATFVASPLAAQAPPPYGLGISFDAAKKAMAAAEAEAKKNNWPVAIAIVDSSGKLAAFSKMDNTQHGSVDIAIGKAVTANSSVQPRHSRTLSLKAAAICVCSPLRVSRLWKAACRSWSTARSSAASASRA